HEPDREQDLVEMVLVVDVDVERALEQRADERRHQKRNRKPGKERQAGPVYQDESDIAACHGEGAMGEIDEIHEAEGDRKPACQHEQQHAVGDAVEQNGQHGRPTRPPSAATLPCPSRIYSAWATLICPNSGRPKFGWGGINCVTTSLPSTDPSPPGR